MTNAPSEITKAQEYVDLILGLGPELFTCLVFIVLGYVLKICKVPGKYIPMAVIVGATAYYGFAAESELLMAKKLGVGFIIGFAAWILHNQVLKRWLDPVFSKDKKSEMP